MDTQARQRWTQRCARALQPTHTHLDAAPAIQGRVPKGSRYQARPAHNNMRALTGAVSFGTVVVQWGLRCIASHFPSNRGFVHFPRGVQDGQWR